MRTLAVAKRLLNQIRHDKRTLALVIIAPLLILTLVFFLLNQGSGEYKLGVINASEAYIKELKTNEEIVTIKIKQNEVEEKLKAGEILASLDMQGSEATVDIDASDPAKAQKILAIMKTASFEVMKADTDKVKKEAEDLELKMEDLKEKLTDLQNNLDKVPEMPGMAKMPSLDAEEDIGTVPKMPEETNWDTVYVYGKEDANMFDSMGAALIGLVVFFLTYIIAGISFLTERTSGSLEKLLSTPIRRREIVQGYVIGFGVLALIQSIVVTLFTVYVLGVPVLGNIFYVLLIIILTAICALTMALLLSTLANSEFQVMQFIPIVILPQTFLCGLFELNGNWEIVGHFVPLYYTVDALKGVMTKGFGLTEIWLDLLVLAGISIVFILLNIQVLKKQRAI
ncbi:MAG: ABC transporter permease [Anaerovoracaceae bacterium]